MQENPSYAAVVMSAVKGWFKHTNQMCHSKSTSTVSIRTTRLQLVFIKSCNKYIRMYVPLSALVLLRTQILSSLCWNASIYIS